MSFQKDLDELQIWADKWGMKFNASNCQIMRIYTATKPHEIFYILNKQLLAQIKNTKDTGVMITETIYKEPSHK